MPVLVVSAASAAGTALSAATAARRTGIADKVITAAVLIAAAVEVAIDVGVPIDVAVLILILIDVQVAIDVDIGVRVDVPIGVDVRVGIDASVGINVRVGVELWIPATRLIALQRVALIALDVELALRTLQVALQRAAGALEILLFEVPRRAELLAQRGVLESNRAAVRGIELPMILSRRQIGVIESIVVEHIDGDRAAAGPTAVPAPVVVTP